MIGSGLKKLAKQHDMRVSGGIAYGSLMGFATTLCEGSGWKRIDIATRFADMEQQKAFQAALYAVDTKRQYRVQNLAVGQRNINVVFQDTMGTMKKIEAFIAWFILCWSGTARIRQIFARNAAHRSQAATGIWWTESRTICMIHVRSMWHRS